MKQIRFRTKRAHKIAINMMLFILRYLRCPAAVSVSHLQKLIRAKYDLTENHRVDILHNQDCLNSYLTLMDVAYIYLWRRVIKLFQILLDFII